VLFCAPIGHRQESGDYRESWQPAAISQAALRSAQDQARKVVQSASSRCARRTTIRSTTTDSRHTLVLTWIGGSRSTA
jgi:hypothetical protein